MAPKRRREAVDDGDDDKVSGSRVKMAKRGFQAGPDNLPDGPWRRRITKIKQDLIHKAKVKKAYAKVKACEQQSSVPSTKRIDKDTPSVHETTQPDEAIMDGEDAIHPTRELILKDEQKAQEGATAAGVSGDASDGRRRRTRRPGYYDKQLQKAAQNRAEAEARAEEQRQRREERERKLAERARYKKAMAKTRDRHGRKKLGRESDLLLDKVRKLMAQ